MARIQKSVTAKGRGKPQVRGGAREAADETIGGGGGGRGGRARGTASRGRTRTTSESTGEIGAPRAPSARAPASGRGKVAKADAPRGRGTASGGQSSGARKSVNRPGHSGSGKKR